MEKKKAKVLVACSGGPDSMALLDMAKDKYDVMVAHVNYHHRESAKRDEDIVRAYCIKHSIPFFLENYIETKGNFQDQARVFRYSFFARLVKEYNLKKVLVAHHKDDLIETYLLQKKRGSKVSYYGLKKEVVLRGVTVYRPLLSYTKKNLEKYCQVHNIAYGIDESNLSNDYSRNRIRHEVVERLSIKEKNTIVKEIKQLNKEEKEKEEIALTFIAGRTRFPEKELLNRDDLDRILRILIVKELSDKQVKELIKQLTNTSHFEVLIKNKYICKEYGYIEVYPEEKDYIFTLNETKFFKDVHFKLSKKGNSKQGVTISEKDFPITIRNYREGDFILMRYGTKKISRFFIDNKISSRERKMWPILLNKDGSAILVPNIGCDRAHYSTNHNLYMIKL